jgi:hypothetical protein
MTKTIFRSLTGVRRTSVPRRRASRSAGSFGDLLARLGFASEQLKASRPRRRR